MNSSQKQDKQILPFISKLSKLLELDSDLIRWKDHNIYIKDTHEFTTTLLPLYFRHNQISSFIRQLNKHGFKRVKSDENTAEFSHALFKKDEKEWHKIGFNSNSQDEKILNRISHLQQMNEDVMDKLKFNKDRLVQLENQLEKLHSIIDLQNQFIQLVKKKPIVLIYVKSDFDRFLILNILRELQLGFIKVYDVESIGRLSNQYQIVIVDDLELVNQLSGTVICLQADNGLDAFLSCGRNNNNTDDQSQTNRNLVMIKKPPTLDELKSVFEKRFLDLTRNLL